MKKYPRAFDDFYSDHFGMRDWFTGNYAMLMERIERRSPSPHVTYGTDGWMFLGSIRPGYRQNDHPMGDFTNVSRYSTSELRAFGRATVAKKRWLEQRGIAYLFVIAPNKHTIYYDMLPSYLVRRNVSSSYDQILSYLKTHTDVTTVDLRPVLLAEKKRHRVYFKYDSHWNSYGANVAQFELLMTLERLLHDRLSPHLMPASQFREESMTDGDLARMVNRRELSESRPIPVFSNTCTPHKHPPHATARQGYSMVCEDKKLAGLFFADSFFYEMEPYISRAVGHSTYVWSKMTHQKMVSEISKKKPDFVVEEWVERHLPSVPRSKRFEDDLAEAD